MAEPPKTMEDQYSLLFDVKEKHGIARLGLMVNESWNQDPKRTLFTLARYKFVARMLAGASMCSRSAAPTRSAPVSSSSRSARSPRPISIRCSSPT